MLKVCSFLPAVTQMLYDMGLQNHLFGITFECPEAALREKRPIVRCILEGKDLTSKAIDSLFSQTKNEGKKLYYVDEVALAEIAPSSLDNVFNDALTIAKALGKEKVAHTYLNGLNKRIDTVVEKLHLAGVKPKRVMLIE